MLFLSAAATFTQYVPFKRISIIDDGSLTQGDYGILQKYIPDCDLVAINDIDTGACPRGGTWERLIFCLNMANDHYVVQLDADTLTTAPIPEVTSAIANNQSFILGTVRCNQLVTLKEAHDFISHVKSDAVQIRAELVLAEACINLPDLYIRGCSAFAGFMQGLDSTELVQEFSQRLQKSLGDYWQKWGSEQVASNYILANSCPVILRSPNYINLNPEADPLHASFVHFIGNHRFHAGTYKKMLKKYFSETQK